jgi:hypothetical protein
LAAKSLGVSNPKIDTFEFDALTICSAFNNILVYLGFSREESKRTTLVNGQVKKY